jgi:hypothetical protein
MATRANTLSGMLFLQKQESAITIRSLFLKEAPTCAETIKLIFLEALIDLK